MNSSKPVIGTSKLSGRLLPTARPRKETCLAEYRKRQATKTMSRVNKTKRPSTSNSNNIRRRYGTNTGPSSRSSPAGTGVLFTVAAPRPRTASTSRNTRRRQRPGKAITNYSTNTATNNTTTSTTNRKQQKLFVAEHRVSVTNSSFKQYRHPVRVDNHLPDTYKRYDLQGHRLSNAQLASKEKQILNLDTVFERKGVNPNDLDPKPKAWPNIGDLIKIRLETPSTGWVRVAPGEIGEVLDTGHVSVKAIFPSGLGVPWTGEVKDVIVMALKADARAKIIGNSAVSRLRGIPETSNRGRRGVGSFYGQGFFAARRRGGGMVRARITVPHEFIGSCGFVVPNYVHSVDAVNYTDEDGCTMYVTMKPGDEKELIPVVQRETKGKGKVTMTPKQYNEGWAYYPSSSQIDVGCNNSNSNYKNKKDVPPGVGVVEIEASRLSEAASVAYHEEFTGTHTMDEQEKQTLLRQLCKQCQSGNARRLRSVLDMSPEVVEWKNQRGRGRTLLHYAGLGGSLEVAKMLLRCGADTNAKDVDGAKPVDLVEKYIRTYLTKSSSAKQTNVKVERPAQPVDPHARRRYRMCRALLSLTTVHRAAQIGDVDRVAFLVREYGDLLQATNKYGMTPLHYAAMAGHVDVCRVLSDLGADWTIQNNLGQTSLDVGNEHLEIVKMYPERLRNERWMSQAEEFARLQQKSVDRTAQKVRSKALQWVRATSAASIIAEAKQDTKADLSRGGGLSRRRTRTTKRISSMSHSSLEMMPGTGLERGGSALSALPYHQEDYTYPSILQQQRQQQHPKRSPNPHSSQWHGSSGLHGSTKNRSSVRSSISGYEQMSINFKGKPPWWDKQRPTKHQKLPKTNSVSFEKDFRARYGNVNV